MQKNKTGRNIVSRLELLDLNIFLELDSGSHFNYLPRISLVCVSGVQICGSLNPNEGMMGSIPNKSSQIPVYGLQSNNSSKFSNIKYIHFI